MFGHYWRSVFLVSCVSWLWINHPDENQSFNVALRVLTVLCPHLQSCGSVLCHKQLQILVWLPKRVLQTICLTSACYRLYFWELIQSDGLSPVPGCVGWSMTAFLCSDKAVAEGCLSLSSFPLSMWSVWVFQLFGLHGQPWRPPVCTALQTPVCLVPV